MSDTGTCCSGGILINLSIRRTDTTLGTERKASWFPGTNETNKVRPSHIETDLNAVDEKIVMSFFFFFGGPPCFQTVSGSPKCWTDVKAGYNTHYLT